MQTTKSVTRCLECGKKIKYDPRMHAGKLRCMSCGALIEIHESKEKLPAAEDRMPFISKGAGRSNTISVPTSEPPNWCFHCNKAQEPTEEGLCPACRRPMKGIAFISAANIEGRISIALLAVVTCIALCYERTHPSSDLWAQISGLILLVGGFLLIGLLCMCGFPGPGRNLLFRTVAVGQHPGYKRKRFVWGRVFRETAKMLGVGFLGGIILAVLIAVVFLCRVVVYYLLRAFLDFLQSLA